MTRSSGCRHGDLENENDDNKAGHGGEDNTKDGGIGIGMDDLEDGKKSSRNLFQVIGMGLDRAASNDADADVGDTKATGSNAAASTTAVGNIGTMAVTSIHDSSRVATNGGSTSLTSSLSSATVLYCAKIESSSNHNHLLELVL